MSTSDMIALTIISGLVLSQYGAHVIGVKSAAQVEVNLPFVVTENNFHTRTESFVPPFEPSSNLHRLRRREAVRMINKEINSTVTHVLKPVKVGDRLLIEDEQYLMPDYNIQTDTQQKEVYDQFDNVYRDITDSEEFRPSITNMVPKSGLEQNEMDQSNNNFGSSVNIFKNMVEDDYLNLDTYKPASSQSLLSYLPTSSETTENGSSKATSKRLNFPNKKCYRASSFLGTFGIAEDWKTASRTRKRYRTSGSSSRGNDSAKRSVTHRLHSPLLHNEKSSINSNSEEISNEVNNHNKKFHHNTMTSDKEGRTNSNSRKSREEIQAESINFLDGGNSLETPAYMKLYKVNGSHILGTRKIRPSKRARKLMFGKTKKIKPFPFSFAFRNKSISFPMKISTGDNNELEVSEFYNDTTLDNFFNESVRHNPEQSDEKENTQIRNLTNALDSTHPFGDRLFSGDNESNKTPTLAPPIYRPGRAEVKFAPTNEDLIRAGIIVPKDETKVNENTNVEHKFNEDELHQAEIAYYDEITKGKTASNNGQDDLSIFVESKHEMTYVLPPLAAADTYRDSSSVGDENFYLHKDPTSRDINKAFNSGTAREPCFTSRPRCFDDHHNYQGRLQLHPSSNDRQTLGHPVYFPLSWYRHPVVHQTPNKWTLYPVSPPPTRRSYLVKEHTNEYSDDETYAVDPPVQSIVSSGFPSIKQNQIYRNWEQIANAFGDLSGSNYLDKTAIQENSFLQHPSRGREYVFRPTGFKPGHKKMRGNNSILKKYDITKSGHAIPSTLAQSVTVVVPRTQYQIPTSENKKRKFVQTEKFPVDIRNFYDSAFPSRLPIAHSMRQSITADSFLDGQQYYNFGEELSSLQQAQTPESSDHNEIYVSHGDSVVGSENTKLKPLLAMTTPKSATQKKSTYSGILRKSEAHNSYHSNTSTNSEVPDDWNTDQRYEQHYPRYSEVPHTSFSCEGRYRGYYADPKAECQVFHLCQRSGQKASFLCPNGTLFSQRLLTCDHWQSVDCEQAKQHYHVNKDLYREPPATSSNELFFLKEKNIILQTEESQPARSYRLHPNPSLVTSDLSRGSSSSSSLIPRYPGLKDLLREKGVSKESYRKLKSKYKVEHKRVMPEPRTLRSHVVDPEMVQPYIV